MSARPLPVRSSARPSRRVRTLASIVLVALALAAPSAPRALPECDSDTVQAALGRALDTIPALAGRGARLLRLERARTRGHAGRRPMRACQGRLVTTAGSGALEYSLRPAQSGPVPFRVRAELFQGGWRRELLPVAP